MRTMERPRQTAVNFSIRMNKQLKTDCENLFYSLGLNMTTAIQIFMKRSLEYGGIPFEVRQPNYNYETLEAMRESNELAHDPNVRGLPVEQALAEFKKWDSEN